MKWLSLLILSTSLLGNTFASDENTSLKKRVKKVTSKIEASKIKLDAKRLDKDKILIKNLTKLRQLSNGSLYSEDDNGGFSSGGGGNAVVCYKENSLISEISLLDYVEGLRKDQSLEKTINLKGESVQEKLEDAFDRMIQRWPFLGKELKKRALQLEREMKQNLLSAKEGKLTPILDMDLTFVPNENELGDQCQIVRFAVQEKGLLAGQRKFNFVKELYEHPLTSNKTKAGIIIHEVIYEEAIKHGAQDSDFVRWFTYFLSSSTFDLFSKEDLRKLENDEGSDFLRGHSLEYYRNNNPYDEYDGALRSFSKSEEVLVITSKFLSSGESCFDYGLCMAQPATVLNESEYSTDFYKMFDLKVEKAELLEKSVSDIAKMEEGSCHPDGGCVGAMVKVSKRTLAGKVSYEGRIIGVFGEGDFAVEVLKPTLRLPKKFQNEFSNHDGKLIIYTSKMSIL